MYKKGGELRNNHYSRMIINMQALIQKYFVL